MVKKISPFLLLLLCAVISCGHEEPSNRIDPSELLKNGYKYILFGSQRTDGIEFYNLGNKTFKPFLRKENGQKFLGPVVGSTGRGYCLRETDNLVAQEEICLVLFDLKADELQQASEFCFRRGYSDIVALSFDNQRIAFTYYDNNSKSCLGIYNLNTSKLEKSILIENRFLENPVRLVWKPNNNSVVLWQRTSNKLADEINVLTGEITPISYYPLDYFQDKFVLIANQKNRGIYLKDLERNIQYKLKENWHTIKFSRDGKYLVAGRLRGKGFETLAVIDANNLERSLQIADG